MRWIDVFGMMSVAAMSLVPAARCEDKWPSQTPPTFAVETYVGRAYNYLDNMVDKDGLPYFDVFWTEPAEAAHDWPDFGDVMSRQLQGAIMARHLTGREAEQRKALAPQGPLATSIPRRACSCGRKPPYRARGRRQVIRPSRSMPW